MANKESATLDNRYLLQLALQPKFREIFPHCVNIASERGRKSAIPQFSNCKPCKKRNKAATNRIDLRSLKLCMSKATPKQQSEFCRWLGKKEVTFYVSNHAVSKTSVAAVRFVDRLPD